MLECTKLDNEEERLTCYDNVAGRVEKQLEEERTGTTEERVESRNEAITETIVGEKIEGSSAPDLYTVIIKNVQYDRNRRAIYTTDDGRYFRRSSGSRVTLRPGDECTIEEGMMGSVFLVRSDGKRNKVDELKTD